MAGAPGWLVPARRWQSLVIGSPRPGLIPGARWKVKTLAVSHPSHWQLSLEALWAVATQVCQ